jgi:hypothetical protein
VDRRIKSLFGHVGCNLWLDSEHGYVEIQSWLLSQQPALLLTANHVKEQKFYLGTNLHVLCIPIQNQESTQSNMIYSSGLRSIIDLKEGRKTTWCTISFSSNLHDLSNLRSIDNSHMSIPQSSPYSVLVVVLLIFLRVHCNWLGQFSWWRLTRTVHLPTDGSVECGSIVLIARAKQDDSEIEELKHKILNLWCVHCTGSSGSMCAGWPAPLTGRVQDRSAPWPAGCKIAVRRDYAVIQSCWLWHSRTVQSFSDMCR